MISFTGLIALDEARQNTRERVHARQLVCDSDTNLDRRPTITDIENTGGNDAIDLDKENEAWITNVTVSGEVNAAVAMRLNNTANISGLTVDGADVGIDTSNHGNKVTVTNSIFNDNTGNVLDGNSGEEWTIRNSVFNGAGGHIFDVDQNEKILFADNTINGSVGGNLFYFGRTGNKFLDGSTGNVNNATFQGDLCGGNTPTGGDLVGFVDGTVLTDDPTCP